MGVSGNFRLQLLGPFGLFAPDGRRIEIKSERATAMIALLADAHDGVRTKEWIQSMVWGSRDAPQANGSLRRETSTLRKTLAEQGCDGLFSSDNKRLRLNLDIVDADVFEIPILEDGKRFGRRGDFLEGLRLQYCEDFDLWLRAQREKFDNLQSVRMPAVGSTDDLAVEVLGAPIVQNSFREATFTRSPKPSVSVLPFTVHSNDADSAWIGSALAEEVSMTLSRYPQLFVVATGSSAALSSRGLTIPQIAEALGVRYLLGGVVHRAGPALKASMKLICGRTGETLWTCSEKGDVPNIITLQEQLAVVAAPQIWTKIDLSERRHILTSSSRSRSNYELYWRANALFRTWEKENVLEAIGLADDLVRLDRQCAFAASLAAFCNGIAFSSRWTKDPTATRRAAIAHYQSALQFGADNVEALGYVAGALVSIEGDMALAENVINRALGILPAYQPTLFWAGWVDIANGNTERAIERFELALRLNPLSGSRPFALAGLGIAQLLQSEHAVALELLQQSVVEIPNYAPAQLALCAAAAKARRFDLAREAATAIGNIGGRSALRIFRTPEHRKLIESALSSVGV